MSSAAWCVAYTSFTASLCYAACFPTLAPFLADLEHLEPGQTSAALGAAVAALSIAKIIGAPVAARATGRYGVRRVLVGCALLFCFANLLYAFARNTTWV